MSLKSLRDLAWIFWWHYSLLVSVNATISLYNIKETYIRHCIYKNIYGIFNVDFSYTIASTQFCASLGKGLSAMMFYAMVCDMNLWRQYFIWGCHFNIIGPAIQEGRPPHYNQCITGEWESESVMEVHLYNLYWYILMILNLVEVYAMF